MIEFKKLEKEDFDEIKDYFNENPSKICDNTLGTVFMWRYYFDTSYSVVGKTLILKQTYNGETVFMMPIGENITNALKEIHCYCKENKIRMKFSFVTNENVEIIKKHFKINVIEEPDWADYMYSAKDLAFMTGRKYNGARNHINAFKRLNDNYRIEKLTAENTEKVLNFFEKEIHDENEKNDMLRAEQLMVREVLSCLDLYKMSGVVLYSNEKIIGFSAGEVVGDVLYVHIEKADTSYRGAYQMLVKQYAEEKMREVSEINREEDLGDEGLRKSKASYNPSYQIKKYTVVCEN